jgi:ribosome-binding protein aMBF1 (putative translation factor)
MKKQPGKAPEEKKTRGRPRKTLVFAEDTENQSESIGQFLKKARKEAGLSVYELSNILEYPYYAIQGWESGSAVPSQEAIKILVSKVSPEFKKYLTA